MKKLTKLGMIIFVLLSLATIGLMSFKSTSEEQKFIFVRTIESEYSMANPVILVTDGVKILSSEKLQRTRSYSFDANSLKITSTLHEVIQRGYRLISSSSGGGDGYTITTYIFDKN